MNGSDTVTPPVGAAKKHWGTKAALLLAVPGIAAVALAGRMVWVRGTTNDSLLGAAKVSASGNDLTPATGALILVVLAAVVAALTVGRRAAIACALIIAACALGIAALTFSQLGNLATQLGITAAQASGRTDAVQIDQVSTTAAPYLALIGAAILLAVAAVIARAPARGLSSKYDRTDGTASPQAATRPTNAAEQARVQAAADWDALSAGADPTSTSTGHLD